MIHIKVIAVGSLTETFYTQAQKEYCKRLSRFADISILELEDEKTPQKLSEAMRNKILETEADRVLDKIQTNDYVIALDLNGAALCSEELAQKIDKIMLENDRITFLIGGSLGLHPKLLKRANFSLSLSKMTFTHNMARILLLEQLYRSFKILNGEPYHK